MSLFNSRLSEDPANLRALARGAGTLRIECSRWEVRRRLRECLKKAGATQDSVGESIDVRTDDLDRLALELSGGLSVHEQATVRASFSPEGGGNLPNPGFLSCFLRESQSRWVTGMLQPGGLKSVFQPIVCCHRREVFGFEALMRAGDNIAGPFDATRVLAAARAAGLTLQLDRQACRTAVSEAARHQISTKLFVNVTQSSLCDARHGAAEAARVLDGLRLNPHQVVFEMVESEPVADWRILRDVLERYRKFGFQFALDDFGAAYSSPVTLCELRPDYVKLDQALIREIETDRARAALTTKLIEAARAFGAKIIAEGIETAGEYHWVQENGVDFAQGFYISRPATPPPFMKAALGM